MKVLLINYLKLNIMKKITFLLTLLTISLSFGQNLISDGTFDTQTGAITTATSPWAGFNAQVLGAAASPDPNVGNGNNGEASMFQVITVTPGETYDIDFDYKWVSGSGNYNMTVRVKDDLAAGKPNLDLIGGTTTNGYTLSTTPDTWFTGTSFSLEAPTGVTQIRLLFYKGSGNRPLRIDNVSLTLAPTASVKDLEQFSFKSYPNPANDYIKLSAVKNINKIEVYNLLGQEVLNKNIDSKNTEVNISTLSKGVYIVKAFIEDAVGSYKFIKE